MKVMIADIVFWKGLKMKLSDNMTLLLTILLNVIKSVLVIIVFAYLSIHFNNIWIMLLAAVFCGGYSVKMNYKNKDEKEEDKNNG